MLTEVGLLIIGFILLVKGADVFVDASVNIAMALKIPNIIVGLTIVAIGTGMPEVVITISASLSGHNDLAISNIVGSNIFSMFFIVGISALIRPIAINIYDFSRDLWVSIFAVIFLLLAMILFENIIPRYISGVFLMLFIIYTFYLIKKAMKERAEIHVGKTSRSLSTSLLIALLGGVLIIVGGQITVNSAVNIATLLGISQRIIGLTVVAMGTSLPELTTSIIAAKKDQADLALGNILGSSVFNIFGILGIAGVITPLLINKALLVDTLFLIVASIAFFIAVFIKKSITRSVGGGIFTLYMGYLTYILFFQSY